LVTLFTWDKRGPVLRVARNETKAEKTAP
jgi:hypothetical protein